MLQQQVVQLETSHQCESRTGSTVGDYASKEPERRRQWPHFCFTQELHVSSGVEASPQKQPWSGEDTFQKLQELRVQLCERNAAQQEAAGRHGADLIILQTLEAARAPPQHLHDKRSNTGRYEHLPAGL